MFGFRTKSLEDVLNETKAVKVKGIHFRIKRINVLDHMAGNDILTQVYETYKAGKTPEIDPNSKKIKEYFSQVLVAAIESPKLSLKEDGPGVFVERLFYDWDMVVSLYGEIIQFTYGKKKMVL